MKAKKKALAKLYSWDDLTRLAVLDMQQRLGLSINTEEQFHYIGGVDQRGNPFVRIDLTPVEGVPEFKP